MDWSDSHESVLSWAIKIVIAAPRLSVKDCNDLEAKIKSQSSARQDDDMVTQIMTTTVGTDESRPYDIWNRVRQNLRIWKRAFDLQRGLSTGPKKRIRGKQKDALPYATTAFDILTLEKTRLDFLFTLAYANIAPMSLEKFNKFYEMCPDSHAKGAKVRSLVQHWMQNDKEFSSLTSQNESIGKKRGLEENSDNSCAKRVRHAPEFQGPLNLESLYNVGSGFDAIMDVITDLPDFDYQSSLYNLQANTIPTSRPDSTWMAKPPS